MAFFLAIVALAAGNTRNLIVYAAVFVGCLWYVTRVMRDDRRERRANEARLPPERRPVRREPRQPITFQLRETATAFGLWAVVVAALCVASGLPAAVTIGVAVFAGFMLATITVAGRHMMFRLTAEDEGPEVGGRA